MKSYVQNCLALLAFLVATHLLWTFQQTAHAEVYYLPDIDAAQIERSPPPILICTANNFPCPCQEGRCPTGFVCNQQQQCFPHTCTFECASGRQCQGGYCIGNQPCWGVLCAVDQTCVDYFGHARCEKKCGSSACSPSSRCAFERCIPEERFCSTEGASQACQVPAAPGESIRQGTQRCVRGEWTACSPNTQADCDCPAVVYCQKNQIYKAPQMAYDGGGDHQCSLCATREGLHIYTCPKPCAGDIQEKRFPAEQHERDLLCILSLKDIMPGPCCFCDTTSHPAHAFPLVFLLLFLLFHRRFRKHTPRLIFRSAPPPR